LPASLETVILRSAQRARLEGRGFPMQGASIYILRCADGSYYTGLTRRSWTSA
jgi:hypothetical protein